MHLGQVKWFNPDKGYGFIKLETGEDVFVHFSVIKGEGYRILHEGEYVEFEMVETPNGYQATIVMRIDLNDEKKDESKINTPDKPPTLSDGS